MAVSGSERSDVWKFFEKTGSKNITCKLCAKAAKQLAYHGGTTNLRDHLLRVHADKYKPTKGMDSQQTMDTFVRKCSGARTKVIDELVLDVVTMDLRPIAIVEGAGMHRLLSYLEPGYRLPSRKHVGALLQKNHAKAVTMLTKLCKL